MEKECKLGVNRYIIDVMLLVKRSDLYLLCTSRISSGLTLESLVSHDKSRHKNSRQGVTITANVYSESVWIVNKPRNTNICNLTLGRYYFM